MKRIQCKCPVCSDQWSLVPHLAVLSNEEKQEWIKNGVIKFVCDDCTHKVDWDQTPEDWFTVL